MRWIEGDEMGMLSKEGSDLTLSCKHAGTDATHGSRTNPYLTQVTMPHNFKEEQQK
jgi:hypothetical protein